MVSENGINTPWLATAENHLIPVRMIPIEIMISIIRMVPAVIASMPVISARIFAIYTH